MALPKEIADFMAKYGVTADEVWKIPQGSAYAVKHKALERVAVEQRIHFNPPQVITSDLANKIVAVLVLGHFKDESDRDGVVSRVEWSFGEAAPYNNKNGYPLAMAEKRAKDRVVLKLLQVHGSIYSEDELDEPKKREDDAPKQIGKGEGRGRANPHVTRPEDIVPAAEYDAAGNPVDNIPKGDPGIERTTPYKNKNLRADYEAAQKEMQATETEHQLKVWGERNKNRIASYPTDWEAIFRGLYIEHRDSLRKEAA